MMNEKAILEIGEIIHVRRLFIFNKMVRNLSVKEIIETYEYKAFKKIFPEICMLAEGEKK